MKIAVYTIALNEEHNVEQWHKSAKDADYLLIADTGSTDKTVELAKKLGIKVAKISIKPWRFDDARNAALALLPDDIDICVSLDMDEVIVEGWREALESMDKDATQVLYEYTWSWRDPQSRTQPQVRYLINKVHARHGYRWKYPVHEILFPNRNEKHKEVFLENFKIHHYPEIDREPNRYNDLIKLAFEENMDSSRYWKYLIDYYLLIKDNSSAKLMLKKYLKKFKNELTNKEISQAYHYLFICTKKVKYLFKAYKVNKNRQNAIDIAIVYFTKNRLIRARKYLKIALSITEGEMDENYREYVWGYLAKNMLFVCNHNLKIKNRKQKISLNPYSLTSSSFDLYKDWDVL